MTLPEAGKHVVDYSIGAAGVAFFLKLLPIVTGIFAFILILIRIAIGLEEWRIRRHERRMLK